MYTGDHYQLREFLIWTRRDIYRLTLMAAVPTFLFQWLGWTWLAIPWVPIAMIGTAAAFIVGFKNTQTYNRLWEARQIYGSIVNTSRSWGLLVKDFVKQPEAHAVLVHRHIAWLTALRFQLREKRSWETIDHTANREYAHYYKIPERESKLEDDLRPLLSPADYTYVWSKKNRATHLISLQSAHLRALREGNAIEPLNYIELENLLVTLYDHQGRCERIKNFPYPRQFASINLFFIKLFIFLVPFGLLNEFQKLGESASWLVWLNIPFSIVVCWVFSSMERVGTVTENPFEGGPNDVPITSLSRTIEIDLREMLDEQQLPEPIQPMHKILM